jgi:hypothetical protein
MVNVAVPTMMWPVREVAVVLAATLYEMVPLPVSEEPEEIVSQDESEYADQAHEVRFVVTWIVPVLAVDDTLFETGLSVIVHEADWVMVNDVPPTVMVPVRDEVVELAYTV